MFKSTTLFAATVATLFMFATSHAQSGSSNAAQAFSPSQTYVRSPAAPLYTPAKSPLETVKIPSQRFVTPAPAAPQPYASSCPHCQLGAAHHHAPVLNYAPQNYAPQRYDAPAPAQYDPQYTQTYSAPVYDAQQQYAPIQNYRPAYRSYAPARRCTRGCGGY